MNPFQAVKDFESALCDYTGARYAVATTSCTMALLLAIKYFLIEQFNCGEFYDPNIRIPKRTYVSVPQSILHAGGWPKFEDRAWKGYYQLFPTTVFDSARYFTSGMYNKLQEDEDWILGDNKLGPVICLSFHWSKTLSIGQGGAILHDNPEADEWFRRARFDGRTEGVAPADDHFDMIGYHAYMSPRDAADGLSRLAVLPKHNEPLPNDNYPDLSTFEVFK